MSSRRWEFDSDGRREDCFDIGEGSPIVINGLGVLSGDGRLVGITTAEKIQSVGRCSAGLPIARTRLRPATR